MIWQRQPPQRGFNDVFTKYGAYYKFCEWHLSRQHDNWLECSALLKRRVCVWRNRPGNGISMAVRLLRCVLLFISLYLSLACFRPDFFSLFSMCVFKFAYAKAFLSMDPGDLNLWQPNKTEEPPTHNEWIHRSGVITLRLCMSCNVQTTCNQMCDKPFAWWILFFSRTSKQPRQAKNVCVFVSRRVLIIVSQWRNSSDVKKLRVFHEICQVENIYLEWLYCVYGLRLCVCAFLFARHSR